MTAFVGLQALAGNVTYPVTYSVGPFEFQDTLSMEVQAREDICEISSVDSREATPHCNSFYVRADKVESDDGSVQRQDADVQPMNVHLTGEVQLASTGGWSNYVAAQLVEKVFVGAGMVVWLVLVWRLLAAVAAGNAFSTRTVRLLRGLGWLTIAGAALVPLLDHYTSVGQVGYGFTAFNEEMLLGPWDGASRSADFVQIALGGLVLLVAEVFRHGADIESEQRLTV